MKVTLIHRGGGQKLGLTGELIRSGKNGKTSKVSVVWPLNGVLLFSALTGREVGSPRGPWRLSDDDTEAFCGDLGLKPTAPKPSRSKKYPSKTRIQPDARQLSLAERR